MIPALSRNGDFEDFQAHIPLGPLYSRNSIAHRVVARTEAAAKVMLTSSRNQNTFLAEWRKLPDSAPQPSPKKSPNLGWQAASA